MWTWISGSDGTANSWLATYGLQGIEGPTVIPGGRSTFGMFYNASAGVFYIHGGMPLTVDCVYNDLKARATLLQGVVEFSRISSASI